MSDPTTIGGPDLCRYCQRYTARNNSANQTESCSNDKCVHFPTWMRVQRRRLGRIDEEHRG